MMELQDACVGVGENNVVILHLEVSISGDGNKARSNERQQ